MEVTDPTPLNAAELAALKAIHDASTPGEWSTPHLADDTTKCNCVYVLSEGYAGSVCDISVSDDLTISDGGNGAPPLEEAKANARLIPALKNAFPRLLKTIEALEAQRDGLLAALKNCIGGFYGGQPGYITSLALQQAKAAIDAAGDHACHPAPGK